MFGLVLDASLRVVIAAAAVGLVLVALRVRSGTARHAAWSAVLVAMLGMPILIAYVPRVEVPLPPTIVFDAPDSAPQPTRITMAPRVAGASSAPVEASVIDRTGSPIDWRRVAGVGYAAGLLMFLARLAGGWLTARRMIRLATSTTIMNLTPVLVSSAVATPLTAGICRPVIVLPLGWEAWPAPKLAAVLAHENAHIARRDSLISLLALINRALFWFHPVAWWLERTLAVAAEHACDEIAAREIGDARGYAQALVDMAESVRLRGGRVAWQALGVDGSGLLGTRIDRLLRGDAFARMSTGRQVTTAIACIAVLALAVACRQKVAPLREDPEVTKQYADQNARTKRFQTAISLKLEDVDALEAQLSRNPEDWDARETLVTYYRSALKVPWDRKVAGLRRHALWLIEHAPEHEIEAPPLSPDYDPEGFAEAKRLWERRLSRDDASPFLIWRAASFFAPYDKPAAETLLLRGLALDPASAAVRAHMPPNVAGYEWPSRLADVYASALLGSESVWGTYNDLRTHPERVTAPYALEVRKKLDASTDAMLITRVGARLSRSRGPTNDSALQEMNDQLRDLGVRYLRRALELDPKLDYAKRALFLATARERLNEADRLANRAHERFMISEDITEHARKDPAKAKGERDEARREAEQALELAKAHAGDPSYSAAVMTAHQVLAALALRDNDRERAVRHLRESVKVPTSEQIQYAPSGAWWRPANRLLKEGERDSVVEFLEAYAQLASGPERQRFLDDAKAIREGRMPLAYQAMVIREGS